MKKRILFYAHYYWPDVASTGQILQDLAEGIVDEFDVTVICTVPSYSGRIEEKYKENKFYIEKTNGVKIIRVPVPEFSKSSKRSRIINLAAYFINARKATRLVGNQDYVFAISQPPIMGGMLGVYGKATLRTSSGGHPQFIYNIQDFNPEQIIAVGYIKNKAILKTAMWLDKRSCRKADLVITVGRDLAETLETRFKGSTVPRYTVINNWVDEKKIYPLPADHPEVVKFKEKYGLIDKFVFMYSGNIGLYYDLEDMFKVIEKFKGAKTPDGKEVVFAFVGAGALLDKLVQYKEDHDMDNVVFIPYQDKDRLVYSLNAADVHMCLSAKGIKGVSVPSKIYGILAVGKPVLGVLEKGSEADIVVKEFRRGIVSEPMDYRSIEKSIRTIIDLSNKKNKQDERCYSLNYVLSKGTSINGYKKCIKK